MAGVSTIRRTNNAAEYMTVDGVVIDERKPPSSIIGRAQNKVCVIGEFERGPVDVVTRIGSTRELVNNFGTIGPDGNGAFYKGFLSLVGKTFGRLYVIRISNTNQITGTKTLQDQTPADVLKIDADSPGAWGNSLKLTVADATDGVSSHFNLIVKRNSETVEIHRNLNLADVQDSEDLTPGSLFIRSIRLDIGDGRPANASDQALATGADGTFAAADYTGSSSDPRGIQLLYGTQHSDIRWVYVGEYFDATVNGSLVSLAATTKTKNVLLLGDPTDDVTDALTDVASYRGDRVGYCYPYAKAYVAEANGGKGGLVTVGSNSFAAAVLAALTPGSNPAGPNGEPFLTGIRDLLDPNLATADYEEFRANGIMALQFTQERQKYSFRSGINTDLDEALHNWARRTITDYLQESIAVYLASFQNKPINDENKTQIEAACKRFLDQQIRLGLLPSKRDLNENRLPEDPILEPYKVDITSLNTAAQEALGIFIILLRVRTYATMDFIVLRTEIGESVEVTEQAA